MGLGKYWVCSAALATGVLWHAYKTREQFYPAMLYLTTSKLSVVIMGNMAFAMTLLFGQILQKVFLGSLRQSESERVWERTKDAVMETCLAMTIFREEFNVWFVSMFTALLFAKIFHWLSQDRVEYIETTPTVSRLAHVRTISFMFVLLAVDGCFMQYAVGHVLKKGPSVMLLFAFEYVILASSTVRTFLKYGLYTADLLMDGRWDNKGVYVFYLELITDLLHLFVYLIFFIIIFMYYGLPLHLVRDLYWTFRNFRARVADFIRYRRVTANMNDRFPDASEDELHAGDCTCIICREEMTAAKKLPCGHCFHLHCLRSWLERQQTCPTCRAPVLATDYPQAPTAAGANQGAAGGGAAPADVIAEAVAARQAQAAAGAAAGGAAPAPAPGHAPVAPAPAAAAGGAPAPDPGAAAFAAAHAAAAVHPHAAPPPGMMPYPGIWGAAMPYPYMGYPPHPYMGYPPAPMAAYQAAAPPQQFAGQQHPTTPPGTHEGAAAQAAAQAASPFYAPYVVPAPMTPPGAGGGGGGGTPQTPEQQAQAHAHAAASAAAAATAMFTQFSPMHIMYPPHMMPPGVAPPGASPEAPGGAGVAGGGAGGAPAGLAGHAPAQMQEILKRQIDLYQAQLSQLQGVAQAAAASTSTSAAPATPSSSAAAEEGGAAQEGGAAGGEGGEDEGAVEGETHEAATLRRRRLAHFRGSGADAE